jgi:hypothetical protein
MSGTDSSDLDRLVRTRIEDWRRRLIDLSLRNPLISYTARETSTLPILSPSLSELVDEADPDTPRDFFLPAEPDEEGVVATCSHAPARSSPGSRAAADRACPQEPGPAFGRRIRG